MIIKIAEYRIKKKELNIVLEAIKEFVESVRMNEKGTFYEAFRKDNSFDFIHLMKFIDKNADKKHASAGYTKKFTNILYPRCQKEPVFTDLNSVKE